MLGSHLFGIKIAGGRQERALIRDDSFTLHIHESRIHIRMCMFDIHIYKYTYKYIYIYIYMYTYIQVGQVMLHGGASTSHA